MGTRINVLMDHDILDYKDQQAVLSRLAPTLPAALAVRDFWNRNDPNSARERQREWVADFVTRYEEYYRSYTGPGSLFLKIGSHAAKIGTGGRWRVFLSIPPQH